MFVLLGVLVGIALPLQTTVNTRLRAAVGSPFLASFTSFVVGALTLSVASLLVDGGLPDVARAGGGPWWLWSGGALGVFILTSNIFLFPVLGSVQTVVLPIAGQVVMGLLIDDVGLFGAPVTSLTLTRAAGAVLLMVGVLGAIGVADAIVDRPAAGRIVDGRPGVGLPGSGLPESGRGPGLWGWRVLGLVAGAFGASQTAINGRLGVTLGSPVAAALISFVVGVAVLFVVVLVSRAPWQFTRVGGRIGPWWMWVGGCLGSAVVFGNALLAPVIGTGLTVMVTQLGMIGGSLLIDQLGVFDAPRRPVTVLQVIGVMVMLGGVAVIRLL